jgi:hypothetical protein
VKAVREAGHGNVDLGARSPMLVNPPESPAAGAMPGHGCALAEGGKDPQKTFFFKH